jgi:hypothetical protein
LALEFRGYVFNNLDAEIDWTRGLTGSEKVSVVKGGEKSDEKTPDAVDDDAPSLSSSSD